MLDPEKLGVESGIAKVKTGNGTFGNGWQPGMPDPNNELVKVISDPERPGIAPMSVAPTESTDRLQCYTAAARLGIKPIL